MATFGYTVTMVNEQGSITVVVTDELVQDLLQLGGIPFRMGHQLIPFSFCIRLDAYATVWEFNVIRLD